MKKINFFLAAVLMAASAVAAEGIVYIDLDRIYRDSQQIEERRKNINAEFADRQQALEETSKKIRDLLDALEKEAPTLSDADKESRQRDITNIERDFRRDQRALVEDRGLRLQELRRNINGEISRLIKQVSEERAYKIVLNPFFVLPLSNERTITHNIILYAANEADVTDDIIKLFDEQAKLDG